MLTDPDDINGGVKGYVKCDIAVVGKGGLCQGETFIFVLWLFSIQYVMNMDGVLYFEY